MAEVVTTVTETTIVTITATVTPVIKTFHTLTSSYAPTESTSTSTSTAVPVYPLATPGSKSGLNAGAWAAILTVVLLFFIGVLVSICLVRRKRAHRRMNRRTRRQQEREERRRFDDEVFGESKSGSGSGVGWNRGFVKDLGLAGDGLSKSQAGRSASGDSVSKEASR